MRSINFPKVIKQFYAGENFEELLALTLVLVSTLMTRLSLARSIRSESPLNVEVKPPSIPETVRLSVRYYGVMMAM